MPAYDSTNSVHNPNFTIGSEPSVVWETTLGDRGGYLFFGDDRIYYDSEHSLSVVDLEEGEIASDQTSPQIQVLTYWDDVLYYSSPGGAYDQGTAAVQVDYLFPVTTESDEDDSNVLWEDDRRLVQGKRDGGSFYGLTDEGEFVVLDAIDGAEQWSSKTPIEANTFIITDSHVILHNYVQISALDIESGEEQWRKEPDAKQLLDSIELAEWQEDVIDDPTDVTLKFGSVRVSEGTLLVSEADSKNGIRVVSGRDLATGDPIWFQQYAGVSGATEDQFFSPYGTWDVDTGGSRWRVGSEPPFGVPHSVIATQDHILVAAAHPDDTEQGRLVAFQQSDGSQSWSIDLDAVIQQCIAVKDTIYATTFDRTLLAISSSSQEKQREGPTEYQEPLEHDCGEPDISSGSSKIGERVAFSGRVNVKGEGYMRIHVWHIEMSNPASQKFQQVSEGDCASVEGVWAQDPRSGDFYIDDAVITE